MLPQHGGADPRLDVLALTIAAVASAAFLVVLRRPVPWGADRGDVGADQDVRPSDGAADAPSASAEGDATPVESGATTEGGAIPGSGVG
ncbi:hypothetical protein ABT390_38170 [Streptomyces aurantiacus]|uniref:Uncharacterized protein n=1 Tax=Streptomyces aurantiacus JA 4570 TaxID=1286094 RepID=S3ZUH8_9ACTN|nr:hypothetical protein [Streptomyces aurantiacus]EPH46843.1 hypothetical protein STRAU_0115 [Streptomyces aurantiacus JA 4570]